MLIRTMDTDTSRRRFLTATACGAAAILSGDALADGPASTQAASLPATRPTEMTLGFSTYAFPVFPTLSPALNFIAEAGFDAVEWCCLADFPGSPEKLDKTWRKYHRRQLEVGKLRLSALMENTPIQADDAAHQKGMDRLAAAARLGHDLSPDSTPVVETVLGGGVGKWDALRPLFLRRLADWAALATRERVQIAIKPHRMSAMNTPGQAIGLLKELGNPPSLKMVYDWSHYDLRDDLKDEKGNAPTIESTVAESLPHTVFVAAKDVAIEKGKAAFKLPGETGKTDHAAVIKALYAGGYRGDINCEISSQISKQPGYDALAAMKKCYTAMAAAFEVAGVKRGKR
jgi:sugar phosphate isomerase/epimerase